MADERKEIEDSVLKMAVGSVPGWAWAIMGIVSVTGIVFGTVLHFDVGATANKWMDFLLLRETKKMEVFIDNASLSDAVELNTQTNEAQADQIKAMSSDVDILKNGHKKLFD